MPRPLRIIFPGAWYHVMNRGARKEPIYYGTGYYKAFLKVLSEAIARYDIECHGYCLMGNHYHLLLRTPQANLPDAMRYIGGLYAQQFNRFSQHDGPVFRGRYHAIVVDTDDYLIRVSRYIHLNPYAAHFTYGAAYAWSSYAYYVADVKKPEWLSIDNVLAYFGIDRHNNYQAFINEGLDKQTLDFYEQKRLPVIYGSENFSKKILDDIEDGKKDFDCSDYRRTRIRPKPINIIEAFDVYLINHQRDFICISKIMRKHILIYLCWKICKLTYRELAELFELKSLGHISKIIRNIEHSRAHHRAIEQIIVGVSTSFFGFNRKKKY